VCNLKEYLSYKCFISLHLSTKTNEFCIVHWIKNILYTANPLMKTSSNDWPIQSMCNKIQYQKRTTAHPNKIKKSLMIEGDIIGNYKITKKLGQGSFGTVYEVEDSSGTTYALKMESVPVKTTSQLKNEYRIYTDLKGCKGIAKVHYFGKYDSYYYLVMDKLGPSLQDLYERRKKIFH
ncbi:Casein kinase (serine/threonine/tyrosine protein kinase), partial [Trachipleistophora hominis]